VFCSESILFLPQLMVARAVRGIARRETPYQIITA